MKSISFGSSNSSQSEAPAASRRDILKKAIALGGVTAVETFSPGFTKKQPPRDMATGVLITGILGGLRCPKRLICETSAAKITLRR